MINDLNSAIDFDTWANLAQENPEAFEQQRLAVIEHAIQNAPAQHQQRLRALQWRVDQERRRAKNPLNACIKISRMMWHNLVGEGGLKDQFDQLNSVLQGETLAEPVKQSADIVHFPARKPYKTDKVADKA